MGSRGRAYGSPDSFGFAWVNFGVGRGSRVHQCSRGFTRVRIVVAGFILVRFVSFHLIRSLRFNGARLGVAGVIQGRLGSLRRA